MKTNERILKINSVLQDYFIKHPQSGMVLAKEFMPLFIKNGIFNKDYGRFAHSKSSESFGY